jgi:hypothetical protein
MDIADAFERQVRLPWKRNISAAERVWLVVYEPEIERRLRAQLGEFQHRANKSGHAWVALDLADVFGEWMSGHEYAEAFFAEPQLLSGSALEDFDEFVTARLTAGLTGEDVDEDTVVAVLGAGALFPFTRASRVIESAESAVRGRLAVFFPGHHSGSNYRLLDARDGWNYRATPITGGKETL